MKLKSNYRGLKTENMHANSPAIVLELGFMTNKNDLFILKNSQNQKDLAKSIFEGLEEIRSKK